MRSHSWRLSRSGAAIFLSRGALGVLLQFSGGSLHSLDFGGRVHASAAVLAATIARRLVLPVVEPVVVRDFLAGLQITQRLDKDTAVNLIRLAIRIARVVDEHGHAMAVNDDG